MSEDKGNWIVNGQLHRGVTVSQVGKLLDQCRGHRWCQKISGSRIKVKPSEASDSLVRFAPCVPGPIETVFIECGIETLRSFLKKRNIDIEGMSVDVDPDQLLKGGETIYAL